MLQRRGVDYSWARPGGAALKAAGFTFAVRYVSNDATKNITRAEAEDLHHHGLAVALVWEETHKRKRPLEGRQAGQDDARTALRVAGGIGFPDDRPFYMAVDWDAKASELPAIDDYLRGTADVVGVGRTGVYGGHDVVKHCLDVGTATWAWQTLAWSDGVWDTRAQMQQTEIEVTDPDRWAGAVDLDTATTNDFGQWEPGQEGDMNPEERAWLDRSLDVIRDKVETTFNQVNVRTGTLSNKVDVVASDVDDIKRQLAEISARLG